jgi:hypothetical protein
MSHVPVNAPDNLQETLAVQALIEHLQLDIAEAQDNLLATKTMQAKLANHHCQRRHFPSR